MSGTNREWAAALIVCHDYAPAATPRAFRWTALAEHWAARGHEVRVVAAPAGGAPPEELRNGVHVSRVSWAGASAVRASLRATSDAPQASAAAHDGTVPRRRDTASAALRRVVLHAWRAVRWPDYAAPWIVPAARGAARRLEERGVGCLISVSHPFSGHLAAWLAYRRAGLARRGARWLADVGDPFSFADQTPSNNTRLYRGLNRFIERRMLRQAQSISVTTEGTAAEYAREFPEVAGKISVIPPVVTLPPRGAERAQPRNDPDRALRLVYVGTLYRHIRSPRYLLELVSALRSSSDALPVEIHLYGNANDCEAEIERYRPQMGERLVVHGPVPREAALRATQEADVLVNIGNRTTYQLPSKVIEYGALGKPVLNLASVPDDSSAQVLASYPAALSLTERPHPLPEDVRALRDFVRRAPRPTDAEIERWLEPFTLDSVAAAYERLLGWRT